MTIVPATLRAGAPQLYETSTVAAAAIAGVPPLGAAWTKEGVVAAAGHSAVSAMALAALTGGLSAAYMARFQFQAFRRRTRECTARDPGRVERWALYVLAAATLLLGILWLPAAHDFSTRALGGQVPSSGAGEMALSLTLVALGLAAGVVVTARFPLLGKQGLGAVLGRWLGLPRLARLIVVETTGALARFLDRVVDQRILEAGIRATTASAEGLAAAGRLLGEGLFGGIPGVPSRMVSAAGRHSRRLQTGYSHHYYALVFAGLVVLRLSMLLGG